MGYSPRYHAASLAAVFLALAIGILIGSEFGGDVVSNTRKSLEKSLLGNLSDARGRNEELASELGRSNEFADGVYPVLVRDKLAGRRIGVLALGNLPGDVASDIEDALGPTGARLVAVGVVREPPELGDLAGALSETRFLDLESNPDSVEALGTGLGRQIVLGGTLLDRVGGTLFSRASGRFGNIDGLIIVRDQPDDLDPADRNAVNRLETGLVDGIAATRTTAVGVETTEADPSSISFFQSRGISSVDDVDLVAGHVAMVYALLGAEGSFGVKDSADRLLPDLLTPAPVVPAAGVAKLRSGQQKRENPQSHHGGGAGKNAGEGSSGRAAAGSGGR